MNVKVARAVKKQKMKTHVSKKPVLSFTTHTAYKTVKLFLYVHSIGEHDEQKILDVELVICHLTHKVSTTKL
jgi:DNA-binding ferritin-like protein (Dps family)